MKAFRDIYLKGKVVTVCKKTNPKPARRAQYRGLINQRFTLYPCLEDKHTEKNRELCKCVNAGDETKKDIGRELYNDAGRLKNKERGG